LTKAANDSKDKKKFVDEKIKEVKRLASNALSNAGNTTGNENQEEDSPNKIKEEDLFKEEDLKLKENKSKAPTDLIVKEDVDTGDVTIADLNNYLSFSYGCCSYFGYFFMGLSSALLQLYTTYYVSLWTN
jgi:hypothetical protein